MADDPKDPKQKTATPGDDKTAAAAETSKDDKKAASTDAPAKKAKRLSPVVLAISGVVSLVVFLAVFSYFMGVFDAKPPATEQPGASATPGHDTLAGGPTQPSTYFSPFGRAAASLEAVGRDTTAIDTDAALAELDQARRQLQIESARVQAEKQELHRLKAEVEQLLAKQNGIANEKVLYMAKLLDGMKPDELTPLMAKLDNGTILSVLPNMKPQNASKVLALLPPERAAEIATQLLTPKP
ncbi:MAG: hypothetical protein AB1792_03490 [Candidatus Zixiibacteriota bacterium]